MGLSQISSVMTITLGVITILGLIVSYIKKDSIKNKILNWLDKPADENKPLTKNLTFCDIANGCEVLKKKLSGSNSNGYYIIGVSRGGAILGGMLAKTFKTRRIRHVFVDEEGNMRCGWDVSELKNQQVLLVDDCIRNGITMNKAHKLIKNLCEEQGFEVNVLVVSLLCIVTQKDQGELDSIEKNKLHPVEIKRNVISAYTSENPNLKFPWDSTW